MASQMKHCVGTAPPATACGDRHASTSCLLSLNTCRWAYCPERRRCVTFWYGGCHPNANNFATKRECNEACRWEEDTRWETCALWLCSCMPLVQRRGSVARPPAPIPHVGWFEHRLLLRDVLLWTRGCAAVVLFST